MEKIIKKSGIIENSGVYYKFLEIQNETEENLKKIEQISKKYPFLTFYFYNNEQYAGILQGNHDKFMTIYVYNFIKNKNLQTIFLKYGEIWWWESSRNYPINLFLGNKFDIFSFCLRTFNVQSINIISGPFRFQSSFGKESKRKQVFLLSKEEIPKPLSSSKEDSFLF